MAKSKSDESNSPYPGLRYYEANQADFFAGREEAAKDCARLLGASRVVILHGRSGCGKSSFLRAGVKPLLENADRLSAFPENFEVVRSTEDPIRKFGDMLLDVADKLVSGKDAYWKIGEGVTKEDLADLKEMIATDKRTDIRERAGRSHRLLTKLAEVMEASPVFVVDQGEEVFTLYEKRERVLAKMDPDKPETAEKKRELRELEEKAGEFFELLGRVAEKGPSAVRIVVSLRTEYKGQLDDRISGVDRDVSQIRGYYLEDLDQEGLIAAIERPTLGQDKWSELQSEDLVGPNPPPFLKWGFKFRKGVPEALAKKLVDSDQVPEGGVLPTLQIACLRLHEQAKEAATRKTFEIKEGQLLRIGSIDSQIQEFLSQRLEEACRESHPWEVGEAEAVERWHLILFNALVEVQADGRAVTGKTTRGELAEIALSVFAEDTQKDRAKAQRKINDVITYLLKKDGVALISFNELDDTLALGHDSVALSLNKWNVKYNRDDRMTMRSMMMGDIMQGSEYSIDDLFPKRKAVKTRPHSTDIVLHVDDHWDRQYPQFAFHNAFAKRLGFNFVIDREELNVTRKTGRGRPKDWDELAEKLRKAERASRRKRLNEQDPVNERIMVAADWSSFPRSTADACGLNGLELKRRQRQDLQNWSDILVTDLFTGNALIGPEMKLENPLQTVRELHVRGDVGVKFEDVIKEAFGKLVECKGLVFCHDDLALRFIRGSAELACGKGSDEHEYVCKSKNVRIFETEDTLSSYPLADWFLDGDEDGDDRPRFLVGTAATRAITLQGGGQLYFGTAEVTRLARTKINRIRDGSVKRSAESEADLHELIQNIIKHTSWQLGISPSQWNQGRNRAMVLRLASIGYYTAEYIRSNADEFVRFIRDQVNGRLSGEDGKGASRGARMNIDSIRTAIRECYSILKFDEYGTEFYDLDSTTAYATEHPENDSKSVASEIYNELASLRHRTIVHYETVSRMIIWLRDRGGYQLDEEYVKDVSELKDCAWRNYRILNFYDSARLMAQASLILQSKIETHGKT